MTNLEILEQLKMLPTAERLKIVESTVHELREELGDAQLPGAQVTGGRLAQAAQALLDDYTTDSELTAFTSLDSEPLHA
jgi:hypothetical protein